MNTGFKIHRFLAIPLASLSIWAHSDSTQPLATMKLEKARAKHPNMQIINYHQPTDESLPITVLYNKPPDKTIQSMSINNKTGDIITDRIYKKPEKTKALKLEELVNKLSSQYPIKRVKKSVLNQSGTQLTRTIHYVDHRNHHRTIVADARTGQVLEAKAVEKSR